MDKQAYERLCEEIWHHNRLYYVDHAPVISDQEYDFLLAKLETIEKEHPEWINPTSPTQRVGESLTKGFRSVIHRNPMLSLANTYSKEEIADFIKRMEKLGEKKNPTFAAELKMDGIAISIIYEKGVLVQGTTRGDGRQGDDVTTNLRTIESLPLRLFGKHIPDLLELRGEVFMPHDAFKKLNKQKELADEELFANPRNAAAGSLKMLDPKEVANRQLSIVFYGVSDESSGKIKKQSEIFPFLHSLGLPTVQYHAVCHSMDDIWAFAEKIHYIRRSLNYDIDGIVIKLDDFKEQKRLGNTGKNPRWAIAYKFAAEQGISVIKEITVQVGRTGILTPVAELEPTFLAGSTISRATLHNEEEIQRKDIRVGDTVLIEKGGDVIPKVVSVDLTKRPVNSIPWKMPTQCPACGTTVVKVEEEVAVRCPNTQSCPEQHVKRLIFFAGKNAFDIEHLGEKIMLQLVQNGFVSRPSDLFLLTAEQLAQLSNFKEKSVQNLLTSIEKAKNISLARFIMALGIKHVGAGTAELLASKAGTIQQLMQMKKEELLEIEGIGEKVAESVTEYFVTSEMREEIERLLQAGVMPQVLEVVKFNEHPFLNKTFVLTGSLEHYTRNAAASLIKERGGKVTNSVSKNTDFILAGSEAGSKLDKGQELGVRILSEAEFTAML